MRNMNLIKPLRLKQGDKLGVIAISTPISRAGDETIARRNFSRKSSIDLI